MIPAKALDQHIAVLGKTGSGKTFAVKGVVERLLDEGRQVCVLDPTGAWWGLRLDSNGRGRGYERVVLLGGAHGDIPLAERSGGAVARLVTQQGASVVIDTSGFTVGEYTRWFIDFASTLYTAIINPLHLVIDEAHHFMPQGKSPDVDAGRMLHAGNRLMSGGRSKGIRGVLITQRPAKLHKDSLTCADTLIALRVIAPQDRGAIKDWIDGCGNAEDGRRVLDSLAGLARGEGWVWYPEGGHLERVKFPPIRTYDSSATPKHGAKAGPEVAAIDLEEVRRSMAEAVREAEANDPKLLRKRIAELEAATRKPTAAAPDRESAERMVRASIRGAFAPILRQFAQSSDRIARGVAELGREQQTIASGLGSIATLLEAPMAPSNGHVEPARAPARPRLVQDAPPTNPGGGRRQRLLDAAATLETLGVEVTRETVCAWIGVHPRGGSVGQEIKALADEGFFTIDRGRIALTEAGRASAGTIDRDEAVAAAKASLTPRQARILTIVLEAYPDEIGKDEIAEKMGVHPRGGSFGQDVGRLAGRGLVSSDRGRVKARDFLFAGAA